MLCYATLYTILYDLPEYSVIVLCCTTLQSYNVWYSTFTFLSEMGMSPSPSSGTWGCHLHLKSCGDPTSISHPHPLNRDGDNTSTFQEIWHTILYTILYYAILYYSMLYYIILYYAMLCYAILLSTQVPSTWCQVLSTAGSPKSFGAQTPKTIQAYLQEVKG